MAFCIYSGCYMVDSKLIRSLFSLRFIFVKTLIIVTKDGLCAALESKEVL